MAEDEKDDYSDLAEILERGHRAHLAAQASPPEHAVVDFTHNDYIPPDLRTLPLPAPGLPSRSGYLEWLEACRPQLEFRFLQRMTRARRADWDSLCRQDLARFPELTTLLDYDAYKTRLQEASALAAMGSTRPGAHEHAATLGIVDPACMQWSLPFDLGAPAPTRNEAKSTPLNAKEELRQHYLKLLLPVLETRAPVWWKVLSVLHEKSPDDFTQFKLSNRKLAATAGVHLRSVPDAIKHLEGLGLILLAEPVNRNETVGSRV